mgnify:FL=1|jgi:hypothetical protein
MQIDKITHSFAAGDIGVGMAAAETVVEVISALDFDNILTTGRVILASQTRRHAQTC